jgi:hypothetical protein
MTDEKALLEQTIEQRLYMAENFPDNPEYQREAAWLVELREIKYPTPLPPPSEGVVSLDQYRIRAEQEFEDEQVAYVEALWGKETYAFNVAIRDLEGMRRGTEDLTKPLRTPQTYHEALHMVLHVRALGNDLARHFGLDDLVRPVDDLHPVEEKVVKVDLTSPTAIADLERQITDKEEP